MHDGVTGEFVNVGVALYSADAKWLGALCTPQYGRITKVFDRIDGERFRQLVRHIQEAVIELGRRMQSELEFEPIGERTIEKLLAKVLPPDDSSLQFSPAGAGLSDDPTATLTELYERYVVRYAGPSELPSRSDEEVWRSFREPLEKRNVLQHLAPKRIIAPDFDWEFRRAWRNEVWHVIEPVSLDLVDAGSILDKANRWVGRAISLLESSERFQIHLLVGKPQDSRVEGAYHKAWNILRKMPGDTQLVLEDGAEEFASELEREIGVHQRDKLKLT
jgi:Protein of unknown function (DUF3037)